MPKRGGKGAIVRRKRVNRYHKRSEDSSAEDSENMSVDIKEIFDQMDIIYGELEVNSNETFTYQSHDLAELDASLDFIYEQIGKWLVGYCGCLVQREQTSFMNIECLENLLDKLLGIGYQLDSWSELVTSVLHDLRVAYDGQHDDGELLKDLDELERRHQRVQEVQNYLSRIKERHAENLVTNDRRPFSELTEKEKDTLAYRYGRFVQASFPSTPLQRLDEIMERVSIDKIPHLLEAY